MFTSFSPRLQSIINDNPWMQRHVQAFTPSLESWRVARKANPSWKHLTPYGKVVSWIQHNVGYITVSSRGVQHEW